MAPMTTQMFLAALVFLALLFYVVRSTISALHQDQLDELDRIKESHNQSLRRLEDLRLEKKKLQKQAEDIFTLYEITKEITKNFNFEEAFDRFRQKLNASVYFEDCQFFEPLALESSQQTISADHQLFSLHSKERKLGLLAIKGLLPQDQEKVIILTHQFALALRRIKLYEQVENLALTDSLTQVHTRRYFMERFEEELKRAHKRKMQLSYLLIDVDHFKSFNDQYGHLTGDQILQQIGVRIKENIREIDIAGRYGGEEFCVVLPDTGSDGAQFVAERIRSATADRPIRAYDNDLTITISIGVATFPKDAKEPQELTEKADAALYRAKEAGRNKVVAY